jgi:hypothetical protein
MREGAIESAEQSPGMSKALILDYGAVPTIDAGLEHRWADSPFGFYSALSFSDPNVGVAELTTRLDHGATFLLYALGTPAESPPRTIARTNRSANATTGR